MIERNALHRDVPDRQESHPFPLVTVPFPQTPSQIVAPDFDVRKTSFPCASYADTVCASPPPMHDDGAGGTTNEESIQ
jgi:hypothetical protein